MKGPEDDDDVNRLAALTSRVWPVLLRVSSRFGQDAGDVASEAYVRILSNERNGKRITHENVEALAAIIGKRKGIDLWRKQQKSIPLEGEMAVKDEGNPRELLKLLMPLSAPQRVCLLLQYENGYSCKEIAKLTGYSEKQVKSHIQNGKISLKKLGAGGET